MQTNYRYCYDVNMRRRIEDIPYMDRSAWLSAMWEWFYDNIQHDWSKEGWRFWFEDADEAILFRLTWDL